MDHYHNFPDALISGSGVIANEFLKLGITGFIDACRYVHELPYGYNSDRDDLSILFREGKGSCTTKHAVIATLAEELSLPIFKNIGIYAMTEEIVSGTQQILEDYNLPHIPMVHCYLVYDDFRVYVTEGNHNGKNRPIDNFLYTQNVIANISAKDEYLLYRNALKNEIILREELNGVDLKYILQAREEGIKLLRSLI
jgi:hypothetical protein